MKKYDLRMVLPTSICLTDDGRVNFDYLSYDGFFDSLQPDPVYMSIEEFIQMVNRATIHWRRFYEYEPEGVTTYAKYVGPYQVDDWVQDEA